LPKYTGGLREVVHPLKVAYYLRVVRGVEKILKKISGGGRKEFWYGV